MRWWRPRAKQIFQLSAGVAVIELVNVLGRDPQKLQAIMPRQRQGCSLTILVDFLHFILGLSQTRDVVLVLRRLCSDAAALRPTRLRSQQ